MLLDTIEVPVPGKPYPVHIGEDVVSLLGPTLKREGVGTSLAVMTDTNVARFHLAPIVQHLEHFGFRVVPVVVPAGERQKSLARASKLVTTMLESGLRRSSAVLAVGGGVVGDLAGFVAAIYQRGIDFVPVPTTLLAQVDSAIGGKVAVNHPLGKNMIGAFHQPRLVWSDTSVLRTLPKREIVGGMGEVIKYGVMADPAFFEWLEEHLGEVLELRSEALLHVLRTCVSTKARIVGEDERESGVRENLNVGHTIGHALEAAGGYGTLRHGEAVLAGMMAESYLAHSLGMLERAELDRIVALVRRIPVNLRLGASSVGAIVRPTVRDKKNRGSGVRFILPERVGRVRAVEDIPADAVRRAVGWMLRAMKS